MKIAIAAVLSHCVRKLDHDDKEDKADRHKYCPKNEDTWCKYQKGLMDGTEFKGDRINIAEEVYNRIRPVWMRLYESALLKKMFAWSNAECQRDIQCICMATVSKSEFCGQTYF